MCNRTNKPTSDQEFLQQYRPLALSDKRRLLTLNTTLSETELHHRLHLLEFPAADIEKILSV